ncbi:DUF4344 domain-containing metallopeptidase [Roseibium sp.]|uniref:DUF4344 domain-containing metallopeptidase n=1 Tax=Roseibium sp. TaxID=1936156 RepID=UPI003A97D652
MTFSKTMQRLDLVLCSAAAAGLLYCSLIFPSGAASAEEARTVGQRIEALAPDALEELFVFVGGNVLFTLHHEAGHMLVSELKLPVLGQEEDAVDNLATISMLAHNDGEMDVLLSSAMVGWFLTTEDEVGDLAFYDEHDLNLQRGYRMLCLMVGSDPAAFGELASDLGLPPERIETCRTDYDQAVSSWEKVTDHHLKVSQGPGRKIAVRYGAASEPLELMAVFLQQSLLMEIVAEEIDSLYALPQEITFRSMTCGAKNAYWDPELREMTLCYELVEHFAATYLDLIATH